MTKLPILGEYFSQECDHCGRRYSETAKVCPYCNTPNPDYIPKSERFNPTYVPGQKKEED